MSEIKVGEYVRTKDGYIGSYVSILDEIIEFNISGNKSKEYTPHFIYYSNIKKHSFNIIDLIEEGDMLNKNEVIEVKGMGLCIYDINNKNWLPIGNIDYQMGIELAIVTHEQMKGMEYKVC